MSDEYEYEDDERQPRRFTFGQIMVSLLLLGVVVLIGLIVLVYFTLTEKQPTHTFTPTEVSAPVRPVERFGPDGKPVAAHALPAQASNAQQTASEVAAQQKAADKTVNNLQNNRGATQIQQGALVAGAAAGVAANQVRRAPKPRPRRQAVNENGEPIAPSTSRRRSNSQAANDGDEVPLQPVQRGERRLTPRNNTQERQLTPRRQQNSGGEETARRPARAAQPSETRERPLTPTRPQGGKSEAIEQLF